MRPQCMRTSSGFAVEWTSSERLVVVNNANDFLWEVSNIIPYGRAGSVVFISEYRQASRLL